VKTTSLLANKEAYTFYFNAMYAVFTGKRGAAVG
jgi:hypothetical protein